MKHPDPQEPSEIQMPGTQSPTAEVVLGFIVGMSRGGTTWLSASLNAHDDIAVIGETAYWGRLYVTPEADGKYSTEQQKKIIKRLVKSGLTQTMEKVRDPAIRREVRQRRRHAVMSLLDGSADRTSPEYLFADICKTIADSEGKKWVIEKTPHHILCTERLMSAYPNAKFIVMFREPYSFMLSYKHQGDQVSREEGKRRRKLYHPLGSALVWRGFARSIIKMIDSYPDKSYLVKQSQITEDAVDVLENVQNFLGVSLLDGLSEPNTFSSFSREARPSLDAIDIFWMNLVAGTEIKHLDLEMKNAGLPLLAILGSLLMLPVWGTRVLIRFVRVGGISSLTYLRAWISS